MDCKVNSLSRLYPGKKENSFFSRESRKFERMQRAPHTRDAQVRKSKRPRARAHAYAMNSSLSLSLSIPYVFRRTFTCPPLWCTSPSAEFTSTWGGTEHILLFSPPPTLVLPHLHLEWMHRWSDGFKPAADLSYEGNEPLPSETNNK